MKYDKNDYFTERIGFPKYIIPTEDTIAGLIEIYEELKIYIAEILGMDIVDLTPAAGAHGELKGLLIAKRYFEDIGELHRNEVIIPMVLMEQILLPQKWLDLNAK